MIKTIIVEDEIAGQELLKKNIQDNFPDCNIETIVEHVDKAIKEIERIKPDLVFLDIHIKGGTGFDILKYFKKRDFEVIFVTAYNNFAIQAIKEEAVDYLLKPINTSEFIAGVSKAIEKIKTKSGSQKTNALNSKTLNILTATGSEFIYYDDILFLEAEGAYTYIHLHNSKVLSAKNIGEYEIQLEKHSFFRTHHSFIVNITHIAKFDKGRSGTITMKTGQNIPVSQRKIKEFVELLK